eukprot:scaffold147898_cov20-Tisochrysis_lutea.AAC.1
MAPSFGHEIKARYKAYILHRSYTNTTYIQAWLCTQVIDSFVLKTTLDMIFGPCLQEKNHANTHGTTKQTLTAARLCH